MAKKLNFGQRMQELKRKKAQEAKDKELLERFPPLPPLDAKIEEHLTIPLDATAPIEARTVIVQSQTPLERAVQTLREKAQGL